MRLDDLRPCDSCGGPIGCVFFALQVDQHVVDKGAVQQRAGMTQFFGGSRQAEALAGVFDAVGERATRLAQTRHVMLCNNCFCSSIQVAGAWEKRPIAGGALLEAEAREAKARGARRAPPVAASMAKGDPTT